MEGCWDPEFEPRAEETMTIDEFSQFAFFGELVNWGISPFNSVYLRLHRASVTTWEVEVTSGSIWLTCTPQYCVVQSMHSLYFGSEVYRWITGGEGRGI